MIRKKEILTGIGRGILAHYPYYPPSTFHGLKKSTGPAKSQGLEIGELLEF